MTHYEAIAYGKPEELERERLRLNAEFKKMGGGEIRKVELWDIIVPYQIEDKILKILPRPQSNISFILNKVFGNKLIRKIIFSLTPYAHHFTFFNDNRTNRGTLHLHHGDIANRSPELTIITKKLDFINPIDGSELL